MSNTSVSAPEPPVQAASLLESLQKTRHAKEVLRRETLALTHQLEALFCQAMPQGARLERFVKGAPIWARNFTVNRGNSRGTNLFEVASPISVEVDPTHVEISIWSCEAIPISEKTGKPMSGSAHGSNARSSTTVRIRGYLNDNPHAESTPDGGVLELLKFVEGLRTT